MKLEEIGDAIVNGASVSSVMVPDPQLPSNQPAHDETYALDYFFLRDSKFFAATREDHRSFRELGEPMPIRNSFVYSYGYQDLMATCSTQVPESSRWTKMSYRYSKFHWQLRNDHCLVWDSDVVDGHSEVTALRAAILSGSRFKISMLDEDGLWNVLPADLINLEVDGSTLNVRTSTAYIPALIPDSGSHSKGIEALEGLMAYPHFVKTNIQVIPIFLAIFSDGTYYTYFDQIALRRFRRLMIFATGSGCSDPVTVEYI